VLQVRHSRFAAINLSIGSAESGKIPAMTAAADVIVGREREVSALVELLADARVGSSRVLVVHGGPGIGKTAVLGSAIAGATEFRIMRIAGAESEQDLGFAALHRLLFRFRDKHDGLPERQRDALQSALGETDTAPADRFLVGLAALNILADAALTTPVACIIDDAHWVDRESLDALTFVARRLYAERIALIFSARDSKPLTQLAGLPTLDLLGLDSAAATELLRASVDTPLEPELIERIISETGGNPLAITELGATLSSDRYSLLGMTPNPLPIGERIEAHYAEQVHALPGSVQLLMLAAAADSSTSPATIRQAAAALGADDNAEEVAVASGLLSMEPRAAFRHPLVRSAVYAAASATERRAAHAALASLVDERTDPERRAWHLASATWGSDDGVATELERCADQSHAQGRYASAAALLSRSAELSGDEKVRARRQLDAARAHLIAGGLARSSQLLQEAEPALDSPMLLAQAQRVRAAIDSYTYPSAIPKVRLDAARVLETLDVRLARDTYAEALEACLVSGQLTVGTTPAEVARAALAAPAPPAGSAEGLPLLTDLMLEGFANRLAVDYETAVPILQRAVAQLCDSDLRAPSLTRWSALGNNASADLWDVDSYIEMLQRIEPAERQRGALDALRITLGGLGHAEMWQGRFDVAEVRHSEATEISRALGSNAKLWEMLKVELFAWQGRETLTRQIAATLLDDRSRALKAGVAVNLAMISLTVLEQAQGHYKEALHAALPLFDSDVPPHGSQVLPEIVEAASRTGDRDVAQRALDRLERRATASGTAWSLGLLARSRALLADDADTEAQFRASIELITSTPVRTDLARAHLLYGEWLRRMNRRSDAREHLRSAWQMFSTMGATAFEERARVELAATGERARRRSVETTNDLTAQETQVARLASQGATNREIAATLFISTTTVDYHMRKAFRKLGVTSRRQLRTLLSH
jgi:DNA-binding CsgD family transcriptional regulator